MLGRFPGYWVLNFSFRYRAAIVEKEKYLAKLTELIKDLETRGYQPGVPRPPPKKERVESEEELKTRALETDLTASRGRLVSMRWVGDVGHLLLVLVVSFF